MGQILGSVPGEARSIPVLLRNLGLNDAEVTIASSGVWWCPSGSDPDAASTRLMTKAAQIGMARLGMPIAPTGILGVKTRDALARMLGPGYGSKAWVQVLGSLQAKLAARKQGLYSPPVYEKRPAPATTAEEFSMGYYGSLGDILTSNYKLVNGVAYALNATTASWFAGLQAWLNRWASTYGFSPLVVDSRLGPATYSAAVKVIGFQGGSVDSLAAKADVVVGDLTAFASGQEAVISPLVTPTASQIKVGAPGTPPPSPPGPGAVADTSFKGPEVQGGFPMSYYAIAGVAVVWFITRKNGPAKRAPRRGRR